MYDRILVPTDGSEGVERVADHADQLAAAHDATVHALYVVDTASLASLSVEGGLDELGTQLRSEGEWALDAVTETVDAATERAVREGSPAREIVDYAEAEGCDLVVMGTHGRTGVDRLVLGSVAERVVRTSPVPVTTVRVTPD